MSRVSPATGAAAYVDAVQPGSPCSICGSRVTRGGFWAAHTVDLHVCSRYCAQKFLLLALDTIADTEDAPTPDALYVDWLRFADESFERWAAASERQRERRTA